MAAQKKSTFKEYHLAKILGIKPKNLAKGMVKSLGQKVKKGELVAEKKGALKRKIFLSPVNGVLESFSEEGVLKIKIQAVKKTPSKPPFSPSVKLKAEWGAGAQVKGPLFCFEKTPTVFDLDQTHQGKILATQGKLNQGFWHKARSLEVAGVICGCLPDENFKKEVEREVLLVKGKEKIIFPPLVVLSKSEILPDDLWSLLKKNQGQEIFIDPGAVCVFLPK